MRSFVMIGHRVPTDGSFRLDDLAGGAGRLDVLCRAINSVFCLSHGIRKDCELYLVLQAPPDAPKTIRMVGSELKYLNPDERSTGALIRNALMRKDVNERRGSSPGIYVLKKGLFEVLESLCDAGDGKLVVLREECEKFNPEALPESPVFFLSDDKDPTPEEVETLEKFSPRYIGLGSRSYHSHHCIAHIQVLMDDAGI